MSQEKSPFTIPPEILFGQDAKVSGPVREMLEEINRTALAGKGVVRETRILLPPTTIYSLDWEGERTKQTKGDFNGQDVVIDPFYLRIWQEHTLTGKLRPFTLHVKYPEELKGKQKIRRTKSSSLPKLQTLLDSHVDTIRSSRQY